MLYLAWRNGGHDPFRLYHGLNDDYVPWSGGDPVRPAYPNRLRGLIYGFAAQAQEEAIAFAQASAGSGIA